MAVVVTPIRQSVVSDRQMVEAKVTFTGASSYVTGGIPTVAADYGFQKLDNLETMGMSGRTSYITQTVAGAFNYLICTAHPGSTEVGNGGDPTACVLFVRAYGW